MTTDRHARREALLGRFRVSALARVETAMKSCIAIDGEQGGDPREAVVTLRQSLRAIRGDAHMLRLESLATYAEVLHDGICASPSELVVRQTLVGLEWVRGWLAGPLDEGPEARARLTEGQDMLAEQAALQPPDAVATLDADANPNPNSSAAGSRAGEHVSVLLVDDSALVRMMLEARLREAGMAVETAASGDQALVAVAAGRPDLVLSDIQMPGMGGFELLAQLRASYPTLPVVLLSGERSVDDQARAVQLGASGYFIKDSNLEPLVAHVISHAQPR